MVIYLEGEHNMKPTLLLHACCAPCSSHVILLLKEKYDITLFYSNDNIYPENEFGLRLEELIKFAKNFDIPVIADGFKPEDFYNAVKGYEYLGEKTARCYKCYKFRLEKSAKKAKELGFDFFTTTLSISPYKEPKWLNKIGYELQEEYGVKWLLSNFYEGNGYEHSVQLCKQYDLYQQDYCGCVFSLREMIARTEEEDK